MGGFCPVLLVRRTVQGLRIAGAYRNARATAIFFHSVLITRDLTKILPTRRENAGK